MPRRPRSRFPLAPLLILACGCDSAPNINFQKTPPANSPDRRLKVEPVTGLPAIPFPPGSPAMEAAFELGRKLFYDRTLSIDGSVACSSCHNPRYGFSDNRPLPEGVGGRKGKRNTPTIFNVAFGKILFLDGRVDTLEAQADGPLQGVNEMAHTPAAIEARLRDNSIYRNMFERAYGPGPVTYRNVAKALASFQRHVVSGNSLYDKYAYGGNRRALSQAAVRGLALFSSSRTNCSVCHQLGREFALFTDGQFHNIGVGADARGVLADLGRYNVTKAEADKGSFKTPTLRSITQTRPYMHDGSLNSLTEVVEYYDRGGRPNPHLSRLIRPLNLSAQDKIDLIAFLESLTGAPVPHIGPPEGEQ
jgi:cytochrome c peroxidase